MFDTLEFRATFASLEAFRNHIPAKISEEHVVEYNGIVAKFERLPGLKLAEFKISPQDLNNRVVSFVPVGFGGAPGDVKYSKDKCCGRSLFQRRIEALWVFFSKAVVYAPAIMHPQQLRSRWRI